MIIVGAVVGALVAVGIAIAVVVIVCCCCHRPPANMVNKVDSPPVSEIGIYNYISSMLNPFFILMVQFL